MCLDFSFCFYLLPRVRIIPCIVLFSLILIYFQSNFEYMFIVFFIITWRFEKLKYSVPSRSGRCSLEVLQLSVQQEGEADMDVELLRKGLLAVKLKGEEEIRGKKARSGKSNDSEGVAEEGLMMPGGSRLFFSNSPPTALTFCRRYTRN